MNGCCDEKDSRICLGDDALASVRFDHALSYRKSHEELGVRQSFLKPDLNEPVERSSLIGYSWDWCSLEGYASDTTLCC